MFAMGLEPIQVPAFEASVKTEAIEMELADNRHSVVGFE